MIDIKKEKLLNAIIFFVRNTKNCKKMKLFKLLYFLDFIHFKKYGTTVTGLEYYAWDMGPVPKKLVEEFEDEEEEKKYKEYFKIIKEKDDEDPRKYSFMIFPKKAKPDLSVFTPNELDVMEEVAFQFKNVPASLMSEVTHLKKSPWNKTIGEKGKYKLIDYELAIDQESPLTVEEARERYNLEKELSQTD
jgi:uncharacterized phage-associated protein